MTNILILDCTLRDGGYINNWHFGEKKICNIINNLTQAKIDIIEIGFLTSLPHTKDDSLYSKSEEIKDLALLKGNSLFAGMIAIGEKEIDPNLLEDSIKTNIDIIRITFHNNEEEISKAIDYANILTNKGYKICMQPVGTAFYTDMELLNLINKINNLNPYAFYFVDTLGTLYEDKFLHFIGLLDYNLNKNIKIGFHSHNNLQMAFSNAQILARYLGKHDFIIDSSIFGMGRGAGNLCTELYARFLNENLNKKYNLIPILDAIDNYIYPIFLQSPWGYNANYYLSAIHNCHPNYSSYLVNKQTLTMNDINLLLQNLPKDKRHIFDKNLIEKIYLNFQTEKQQNEFKTDKNKIDVKNKEVLIIAPGNSIVEHYKKINEYIIKNNPIVFAVNTNLNQFNLNYIFISNRKRFYMLDYDKVSYPVIITSNLPKLNNNFIQVDYNSLIDNDFIQQDNAGIMLIRLLKNLNAKRITLAGFDGFSENYAKNYYSTSITNGVEKETFYKKTEDIKNQINKLKKEIEIKFLTPSLYNKRDKK